jgi:methionine-rich copper-binding protein CopC
MRLMIVAVWWAVLAGCADTSANDAAETPAAEEKVTEAPQAGTPQFDNQVEPKRDPVAATM